MFELYCLNAVCTAILIYLFSNCYVTVRSIEGEQLRDEKYKFHWLWWFFLLVCIIPNASLIYLALVYVFITSNKKISFIVSKSNKFWNKIFNKND